MTDAALAAIRELLPQCSEQELAELFRDLRKGHLIHEFERIIDAPAEMILEAVHRAPELTRRMLRGVIADAAFRTSVLPAIQASGWADVTPTGNFAFDYKLDDGKGPITVQVKLQRSEGGSPVEREGTRFGFDGVVYIVETQKTRTGQDGDKKLTRPYRYGEFDVLAVSMQPSTRKWDKYMYTLGRWLVPGKSGDEMATLQPVAKQANQYWTDHFETAASWFRDADGGKRMATVGRSISMKLLRAKK